MPPTRKSVCARALKCQKHPEVIMPNHQELRSLLPSCHTVGKARACSVSRHLPAQGMVGSLLRMAQGRSLQTWRHLRKRDKGDKKVGGLQSHVRGLPLPSS